MRKLKSMVLNPDVSRVLWDPVSPHLSELMMTLNCWAQPRCLSSRFRMVQSCFNTERMQSMHLLISSWTLPKHGFSLRPKMLSYRSHKTDVDYHCPFASFSS